MGSLARIDTNLRIAAGDVPVSVEICNRHHRLSRIGGLGGRRNCAVGRILWPGELSRFEPVEKGAADGPGRSAAMGTTDAFLEGRSSDMSGANYHAEALPGATRSAW
jgi:hypothetical protein